MPRYKVTIKAADAPEPEIGSDILYQQTFDDLDLKRIIRELNVTPRVRRSRGVNPVLMAKKEP